LEFGKADVPRPVPEKRHVTRRKNETNKLNGEEDSHQMEPARMLNMLPKEDEEANLMYLRTHIYNISVYNHSL